MKKVIVTAVLMAAAAVGAQAQTEVPAEVKALLQKNTCLACHMVDRKLVGPGYREIMQKKKYKPQQIVDLIYKPKPANWPDYPAMAALPNVPKEEAMVIAKWIATLK